MRLLRSFVTVSLLPLLLVIGCGDPPNTQYLPIGQRCGSSDECGTTPYSCVTVNYPGGYCERNCVVEGDCPSDSHCVAGAHCRRKCTDGTQCRQVEGYACKAGPVGGYCDVP